MERGRMLLLGLFLGLGLSVGIALLLDTMDTTIKKSGDVRRISGLNTLGVIPKWAQLTADRRGTKQSALVTHALRNGDNAESFRALRAVLQYSFGSDAPQTLLVASALSGEGKTTIAVNLAAAFAQQGGKVLIIDADLKNPTLQKIFGLENDRGLTDLLVENQQERAGEDFRINQVPIYPSGVPNLDVLLGGSWVSDATDLLDSNAMRDLLTSLAENYSHIILDSAPVLESADTSIMAPHVDGIVLVARSGADAAPCVPLPEQSFSLRRRADPRCRDESIQRRTEPIPGKKDITARAMAEAAIIVKNPSRTRRSP